ncbi:MAG: site-specific DNA-methyltransferase, partial [Clostridiales bacterium]|nr:site-specific DNA-methyltransferase [Clostridiales bacterium]
MAAINDLIAQVDNPELRARLEQEVARLNKQKKFGLVFEEHMPECTPLYDMPVRLGSHVALRAQKDIQKVYTVAAINEEKAFCICETDKEQAEFALSDLVVVAQFGELIYPYLKPLDT